MKKWDSSCQDCRRALDMDKNLVKGHFFLGQSLMELDLFDEAIKHLQRAHDLALEQRRNFGDDIASQLRLARKKRWNLQEEKRICQEIELQSYLARLIKEDMERKLANLKLVDEEVQQQPEQQQQQPNHKDDSESENVDTPKEMNTQKQTEIVTECVSHEWLYKDNQENILSFMASTNLQENYLTELNNIFAKVDDRRRVREVENFALHTR